MSYNSSCIIESFYRAISVLQNFVEKGRTQLWTHTEIGPNRFTPEILVNFSGGKLEIFVPRLTKFRPSVRSLCPIPCTMPQVLLPLQKHHYTIKAGDTGATRTLVPFNIQALLMIAAKLSMHYQCHIELLTSSVVCFTWHVHNHLRVFTTFLYYLSSCFLCLSTLLFIDVQFETRQF